MCIALAEYSCVVRDPVTSERRVETLTKACEVFMLRLPDDET
jgi:hypothetical protein